MARPSASVSKCLPVSVDGWRAPGRPGPLRPGLWRAGRDGPGRRRGRAGQLVPAGRAERPGRDVRDGLDGRACPCAPPGPARTSWALPSTAPSGAGGRGPRPLPFALEASAPRSGPLAPRSGGRPVWLPGGADGRRRSLRSGRSKLLRPLLPVSWVVTPGTAGGSISWMRLGSASGRSAGPRPKPRLCRRYRTQPRLGRHLPPWHRYRARWHRERLSG